MTTTKTMGRRLEAYAALVSGVTSRTVYVLAENPAEAERLAAQEFTALVGADDVLNVEIKDD